MIHATASPHKSSLEPSSARVCEYPSVRLMGRKMLSTSGPEFMSHPPRLELSGQEVNCQ